MMETKRSQEKMIRMTRSESTHQSSVHVPVPKLITTVKPLLKSRIHKHYNCKKWYRELNDLASTAFFRCATIDDRFRYQILRCRVSGRLNPEVTSFLGLSWLGRHVSFSVFDTIVTPAYFVDHLQYISPSDTRCPNISTWLPYWYVRDSDILRYIFVQEPRQKKQQQRFHKEVAVGSRALATRYPPVRALARYPPVPKSFHRQDARLPLYRTQTRACADK